MNHRFYYSYSYCFLHILFLARRVFPTAAFHPSVRTAPSTTALNLFQRPRKYDGDAAAQAEIRALFLLWNDALATGDARIVTARYAEDAVLFPVDSDIPRMDRDSIRAYYDTFLRKRPQVFQIKSQLRIGKGWAQDSGIYELTLAEEGTMLEARYSFLYAQENGQWKIQHQHSSVRPESVRFNQPIAESQVRDLFQVWQRALVSLDPKVVADLYTRNAVVFPMDSDTPRNSRDAVQDYYRTFLKRGPVAKLQDSFVQISSNWAKHIGMYEIAMQDKREKIRCRFSFLYTFEEGQWRIAHHHASVMPEGIAVAQPITQQQVRSWFQEWNDALATGDASIVASRYARNAVYLPTLSDAPRTTNHLIRDYFEMFLKRGPECAIESGDIFLGTNWALDFGVYSFTLDGGETKIRARYSFVYSYEDGDWKISHHHSSIMPEVLLSYEEEEESAALQKPRL
ncbi:hypothetical protein FisN_11Hh193 [Fistulifera solaris]|uniref:Calcium/calmodulin-dependent protein kinase II association-domain domain-containing protein n=1 Tax=Fistulifera solaris TaxID=1519565 RepID=A0A1Z5JK16_FISSO|nr:hypothetical protein FisN_11Hh193 [Fistulifera solaris]|eukprot:GAX14350.1 hypothetical protein FisN_11Hh193 [Fistulifera solaris]